MSLAKRSKMRRKRIVCHRSKSYKEADEWDLAFWQSKTPAERLEAYMAIRRDVELVEAAKRLDAESKNR